MTNAILEKQEVLFEDQEILIINKAPGIPLQSKKDDLMSSIYINYHLISRIDQPVSGLCLLAKSKSMARILSHLLLKKKIDKTYIAIVEGHPKNEQETLKHKLAKSKSFKAVIDEANGRLAITNFLVLANLDRYAVFKIKLETGRFHQIRAQMAQIGHSIKGDLKYGAKRSNKHPGIYLHCRKISFIHPKDGKKIEIDAKFPKMGLWPIVRLDL